MKKTGIVVLVVLMVSLTASFAFSAEKKSFLVGSEDEVYYMVPFVSGVEYWFPVYEMFKQAGQQLGVKTKYLGTPEYDVNKHLAVFEQVLARRPAGILIPREVNGYPILPQIMPAKPFLQPTPWPKSWAVKAK